MRSGNQSTLQPTRTYKLLNNAVILYRFILSLVNETMNGRVAKVHKQPQGNGRAMVLLHTCKVPDWH